MFSASAEYYDLIYSTIKDYVAETAQTASLIRRLNPRGRTVLDVACGTGEHARLLAAEGFLVDGLDLDPAFVRMAAEKHRAGRFVQADMADFDLSRRYDVVLCLFSSIGYLTSLDRVVRALRCFREHLEPDGVAVVEPWFTPGVLEPNHVSRHEAEANGVRISRVGRTEIDGPVSRLHFDYEITDSAGTKRVREVHELGLFTVAQMLDAFREAGLRAEHDPHGLTGRGLYIARSARGSDLESSTP